MCCDTGVGQTGFWACGVLGRRCVCGLGVGAKRRLTIRVVTPCRLEAMCGRAIFVQEAGVCAAMAFHCRMVARAIGSLRGRAFRRSGCAGAVVSFAFGKFFGCSVIEVLARACREWTVVAARVFSFCLESDTILSHVYECMQGCVHTCARGRSLFGGSQSQIQVFFEVLVSRESGAAMRRRFGLRN